MKIWLKILLGVLGGFGGGFAAGFIVHKKLNDIQFEEVTEEDLNKLMEGLQSKDDTESVQRAESAKKGLTEPNTGILEAAMEKTTDPDKLRMAAQGKTPYIQADETKKKEYSKIWGTMKEYSNEENANELPIENQEDIEHMEAIIDEFDDNDIREPGMKKEPYQISLGEFYNERREYDKITLDWYDEDNTVLDEREEIIADVRSYIGMDVQELFGMAPQDGDPDSRFIRNEDYGTDYEVIRHHASWKNANLGILKEEPD